MKYLLAISFIFFGTIVNAQTLQEQRQFILDSINYYREMPVRANENYGLNLNPKVYMPKAPYKMDEKLNKKAQRWANRMARTMKYHHSRLNRYANAESIDSVQPWEGGYKATVSRLIIDKYVPSKGHRKHLIYLKHEFIGIGIAVSKKGRKETFICIQTR